MTVRPTESIIHRRLFGLHTSGACVAEARLQGRVGEINAFCETVSCPRHRPTPSLRLKAVWRPQLCDWVTRVHDQAGVNLLRDEGERNCVMPFFDQSNQGSVSDNIDTLKWVRHRIFERPFISHLRAV